MSFEEGASLATIRRTKVFM